MTASAELGCACRSVVTDRCCLALLPTGTGPGVRGERSGSPTPARPAAAVPARSCPASARPGVAGPRPTGPVLAAPTSRVPLRAAEPVAGERDAHPATVIVPGAA